MVRSPIKWVGGKSKIRKKILDHLPPVGMYTCYVEVFSGAAWVFFGKEPSPVEILNDKHNELFHFFKTLQKDEEELARRILNYPVVSRAEFEDLLKADPNRLDDIDRARRFFIIIMASWGGEWEKARFQTSINDGGSGNRLFGAIRTLRQRLYPASTRLSNAILENMDWRECIDTYDKPRTVMYLDPPYPDNNCNYTHNMLDPSEHQDLVDRLMNTTCKWLLSSYDREDILGLFKAYKKDRDYYIYPVEFASGMDSGDGRINREIIITNYSVETIYEQYNSIVSSTGIPDIAINDKLEISIEGTKDFEGTLYDFQDTYLIVRANKENSLIDPSQAHIKRKTTNKRNTDHFRQLRKEISAGLSKEVLGMMDDLQQSGYTKDLAGFVNNIIKESLSPLVKSSNEQHLQYSLLDLLDDEA